MLTGVNIQPQRFKNNKTSYSLDQIRLVGCLFSTYFSENIAREIDSLGRAKLQKE